MTDDTNPRRRGSNDGTLATPPVVDLAAWEVSRAELLAREKAHTRAGDVLAAARRRLPMLELDATARVDGTTGSIPFVEVFEGRDELVAYTSMWYDGAPFQGQCEGCTQNVWNMKDAYPYLDARGGPAHPGRPVVVVTHHVPTEWIDAHPEAPFTFVTDGVEAAIERARQLAGESRGGAPRRRSGRRSGHVVASASRPYEPNDQMLPSRSRTAKPMPSGS